MGTLTTGRVAISQAWNRLNVRLFCSRLGDVNAAALMRSFPNKCGRKFRCHYVQR
jgi:hypothetical protein